MAARVVGLMPSSEGPWTKTLLEKALLRKGFLAKGLSDKSL